MNSGLRIFAKKYSTRIGDGLDFGVGDIIKAAGGLAEAGINVAQGEQKKKQSAADSAAALQACIAADFTASQANAAATMSAKQAAMSTGSAKASADAKAAADAAAASNASAAQDAAAAKLPDDMTPQRVAAAQKSLNDATAKWQTAARGTSTAATDYAKAIVDAWQATLNKASNQQIVKKASDGGGSGDGGGGGGGGSDKGSGGRSWLTTPFLGPVKPWHAAVGAGVGAAAWRLVRGKWGL